MVIKRSKAEMIFDFFNIIILAVLVVTTLYPFFYVAFASISKPSLLVSHTGILLKPLGFELGAYSMVLKNPMIITGYSNTMFYVIIGTCFNLLLTSMGAYILSRKGYFWKGFIMFSIVFTMIFNGGLVPFYLTVKQLGLGNSRWSLILPVAINTYNLIIMRTSFAAIPDSLEESAKIDGAGEYTILFKIILPLSMPVVAVMILFYGVSHWNAWFNAMIFLRNRELFPLQLVLREIIISSSTDSMTTDVGGLDKELVGETVKYATIMVATLPILFIYPFLQKYFVKGVMIGALKG